MFFRIQRDPKFGCIYTYAWGDGLCPMSVSDSSVSLVFEVDIKEKKNYDDFRLSRNSNILMQQKSVKKDGLW